MPRILISLAFALSLAACDSGHPGAVPQAEYEGDLGEAVVRHLIKNLPDPAPGVPKSYCIVKGKSLDATSPDFARRFADLKLRFLSGGALVVAPPDDAVVDPETRLAVFVLQIASIKPSGPESWTVEVGWQYKRFFEKLRYDVAIKDGKPAVLNSTRVEGNWQPAVAPASPTKP
ncbi:MAG: hypothetical protein K1X78_08815 [Verrucomicrobiaceae bacterium]|nr:hypothetical protein [Verrucomicrobiaceae bacterium]